jgi:integrase
MSRKGENIYKRQDGRWEARYIKEHDLNGRAVYGYIYRHSYLEAKKAQTEARADCIRQPLISAKKSNQITLEKHLCLWLQSIKMSIKKSTFSNYDGTVRRHIIPFIGKIPLSKINNEIIQSFINQKLENGRLNDKGGLSVKTVRDIAGILKRSLKMAGIIIDIKMPKYIIPKLRVLTYDEQTALITTAKKENNALGLGVLISMFTGIRIGELCSLKWGDVSLDDGLIKINKTLQRIKNCDPNVKSKTVIDIDTPKTEYSIRNVPIPSFLMCHLAQIKNQVNDEDYILSGDNHYVEPRLCQYRFKKLIKEAGIEDINYHVLRHTFATRCVELGIDVKTISELLGHSNVNITLNRYVHPEFEHQRDCIEKLSASFSA